MSEQGLGSNPTGCHYKPRLGATACKPHTIAINLCLNKSRDVHYGVAYSSSQDTTGICLHGDLNLGGWYENLQPPPSDLRFTDKRSWAWLETVNISRRATPSLRIEHRTCPSLRERPYHYAASTDLHLTSMCYNIYLILL